MMSRWACCGTSSASCRSCRSRRSAAGPAGRAASWRWRAICGSPRGRTPSWDRSRYGRQVPVSTTTARSMPQCRTSPKRAPDGDRAQAAAQQTPHAIAALKPVPPAGGTGRRRPPARPEPATENGKLDGMVCVYLGMIDQRLPVPVADLVPRSAVADYPTNFAAMDRQSLTGADLAGVPDTRSSGILGASEISRD